MASIPATSTTLLRDLANDSQHARWSEFVTRYRPMMAAYLRERFPSVEADDVIQETLIAVWAALPSYRYAPDEKGHFHNYLTGILRNKALRQLYKEQRHAEIAEMMHDDASCDGRARTLAAPPIEVIFCCFSERDKSVYETLTCAAEAFDVSRNTARKYL